jgi:GNAT superfamily N-acetyltransferase
MTLRQADPARDFERIAGLLSLVSTEPVTADGLREDEARTMPGKHWQRWVAEAPDGQIVGTSMLIRYPSQPAGMMNLELVVDPTRRRQGIGTALFHAAMAYGRKHGATRVLAEVRDDSADSLRFAEKRRFVTSHHVFDSALDLATFDETPFAGVVEQLEAEGIEFITLADTGKTDEALRQLYALNRMAVLDEPGSTGGFPTYENWLRIVIDAGWYSAENQFIAVLNGRFVGLAGVYAEPGAPESMFNGLTGVERDERGRGIATALKLLTIRRAKALGAARVTTNNDERNGPMLAINRRFGYVAMAGHYVVEWRTD